MRLIKQLATIAKDHLTLILMGLLMQFASTANEQLKLLKSMDHRLMKSPRSMPHKKHSRYGGHFETTKTTRGEKKV